MDALDFLVSRRSVPDLVDPGLDDQQLAELLQVAVTAHDEGDLRPWRFVVFRGEAREELGREFAAAAPATDGERLAAKPLRAPLIVAVISSPRPSEHVSIAAQRSSAAAVCTLLELAAHGLGFGAMWRTGAFGGLRAVRNHLQLSIDERVEGWIYIGTVPEDWEPAPRAPVDVRIELRGEPT